MNSADAGNSLDAGVWFVVEPPSDLTPKRGSEVVLNCSVATAPEFADANVTWRKDGLPVVADGRRIRSRSGDTSALVLRRVAARSDNGYYQCAGAVDGLGLILSRPTRLRVAGAPVSFSSFTRLFTPATFSLATCYQTRPFCFPVPTKTLSYDSCVTITIHHYCLDICGPCNK